LKIHEIFLIERPLCLHYNKFKMEDLGKLKTKQKKSLFGATQCTFQYLAAFRFPLKINLKHEAGCTTVGRRQLFHVHTACRGR
jgi:hypothetical protein